ncbi:uncharacterized protein LOC5515718 isoform X1 [Nematostella vectensis]|uniref:uncharacterized protein LOC5515718 isoform X1 n=2 Tax=Nematostella vectensis TaxID=45351 RepID=UPI0013901C74|nr:uncharacterized protein LOC5515718 isoform X1 [Nematostella vectensis]
MCGRCNPYIMSDNEDESDSGCILTKHCSEDEIVDELPSRLQDLLASGSWLNLEPNIFALTSNRTNQMTKTHNDLDAILQLLQEKEKDLELAASIGQSLLERNKNLMQKTEAMEQYLEKSFDQEDQLRHEIVMKNELLQKFLKDQEDLYYDGSHTDDEQRSSDGSCKDDSITNLREKCKLLEQHNSHLILEALKIKEDTASEEQKERQLVADCVRQMMEAKDHITSLTDEISKKAEDNVRQQEEISQLINTVVDLQNRHKQLHLDNEELQALLNLSQASQDDLQAKVADLQQKYEECFEILMENQQEMKTINKKIETQPPTPAEEGAMGGHHDSKGSIALEIEESVKRDLAHIHEKRMNLARVLQTVRNINTPRNRKPKKAPSVQPRLVQKGDGFTPPPSLPTAASDQSLSSSDEAALDSRHSYARRSFRKPEKLQIVKPMKGSVTLHQWKKLASPTMSLEETRPGVHVKGAIQGALQGEKQSGEHTYDDTDDEDAPITLRADRMETSTPNATRSTETPSPETSGSPRLEPPRTLALSSIVSEKGFSAKESTTASILAQLLSSPSSSAPEKSSVGQVLASVLQKASEEASTKEPKRAESLRSLANYFSEKERMVMPTERTIPEDDSPPVSPPVLPLPSTGITGSIFSRILGSSSISMSLPPARPVTTTASSTPNVLTTSSPLLPRAGFGRTASGTNLKGLAESLSFPDEEKRRSLDVSGLHFPSGTSGLYTEGPTARVPALRRRASSGDLEKMGSSSGDQLSSPGAFGGRLSRGSSSGNLQDLSSSSPDSSPNADVGFFGRLKRRPSLGSLTDIIQKSSISAMPISGPPRVQRASSIDSAAVFQPSQRSQSPTRLEPGFGSSDSAQIPAPSTSSGFFSGSRLSSLAGVRGMWSRGEASSLPGAAPAHAPFGATRSEDRLEKINKAFALEDFGGMGLMSFFGGKTQNSSPPK